MSIPSYWTDLLETSDLTATFEEHFSCLATTDECAQLLFEIAQKARTVEVEDDELKITFETADGEEAPLYCGLPCEEDLSHLPQSLAAILSMFNGLIVFALGASRSTEGTDTYLAGPVFSFLFWLCLSWCFMFAHAEAACSS